MKHSSSSLRLLKWLILLALALSLANLLPTQHWLQEINTHFSLYYLGVHLVSLIFILCARNLYSRTFVVINVGLLSLLITHYAIALIPFYMRPSTLSAEEFTPDSANIRILYANVYTANPNKAAFKELVTTSKPTLIALTEVDQAWSDALNLYSDYPHHWEILRDDNFGLALYSKCPFTEERVSELGSFSLPIMKTGLQITPSTTVGISLLHLLPPQTFSQDAWVTNKLLLRRLATSLKHEAPDQIIIGDFNATIYSEFYQRFVYWDKLKNAMFGFGLLRTWNAQSLWQRFTIDHILYRGGMSVVAFQRLSAFGSDHFPLLVDFKVDA